MKSSYDDYGRYRPALFGTLVWWARDQRTLTYPELVAESHVPIDLSRERSRKILGYWLQQLSRDEHTRGCPILPAVVVQTSMPLPAQGFFRVLVELGLMREEEAHETVHRRELLRVFDYYADEL